MASCRNRKQTDCRGRPPDLPQTSPQDYASLEETPYLLASPANAERLAGAVQDLEAGQGTERTLTE